VLQRADQPSVQLHLLVQALGQRIRSWQQPVVLAPAVVEAAQGALGARLWSRPIYSLRRRLLLLELLRLRLLRPLLRPETAKLCCPPPPPPGPAARRGWQPRPAGVMKLTPGASSASSSTRGAARAASC
jgi:hypothetical protein